jgi:hypothetical protein
MLRYRVKEILILNAAIAWKAKTDNGVVFSYFSVAF